MCELLGMSANVPTDICFSFTGLVQRGGGTGPHKDGWGITFYEGKGCRTFKDPQPSFNSPIAKLVQDYPIKSCSVIAHIRQANRGAGGHGAGTEGKSGACRIWPLFTSRAAGGAAGHSDHHHRADRPAMGLNYDA